MEKHASIGERADIVSRLNMVSENDVVIQRSAVAVLDAMRKRVNTPRNPEYAEPGIKPFLPGRTSVAPGPADRDAREESYVPELRAGRVDAEGRLIGGNRDLWANGRVDPIEADAKVLTVAQMRVIAGIKARNSRYW